MNLATAHSKACTEMGCYEIVFVHSINYRTNRNIFYAAFSSLLSLLFKINCIVVIGILYKNISILWIIENSILQIKTLSLIYDINLLQKIIESDFRELLACRL